MSSLDPAFLTLQDAAFTGAIMASMLYGAYVSLSLHNIYYLVRKRSYSLTAYTVFLLCVTTIYMGVALWNAQKQLIDDPTSPDLLSVWPEVVVDATYTINTWFADGFLFYRCYIVWTGVFQIAIMVIPALIFLGSITTSIVFLIFSADAGASYSTHVVHAFGTSNWTLSLALNIILTILIASRLLWYRYRARAALGDSHGGIYLSILSISVESAALYATFALITLVTFLTNDATENVFFPTTGNIQVIAPNLIILRIAKGISFTTKDSEGTALSHIVFAPQETTGGSSTHVENEHVKHSRSFLSSSSASQAKNSV